MNRHHHHPKRGWRRQAALCLLAVLVFLPACKGLTDPTTPNSPSDLDGQNANEFATFDGTITLGTGSFSGVADDATDSFVTAVIRDLEGNPVANGTPVTFSTTVGTIRSVGTDPATAGSATQAFVFNGTASVAVRSAVEGDAQVVASIANVASAVTISFLAPAGDIFVSLVMQATTGDTTALEDNAPIDLPLAAAVENSNGAPIPGQTVRFTITDDTSFTARLSGRTSTADASGEAFTVLTVTGVGRVIVEAEVLNADGDPIATSNQVILTTRALSETLAINLEFSDGSTVLAAAAGTIGLLAIATDTVTLEDLVGRRVEFEIVSDTAVVDKAVLAQPGRTSTNADGEATNAVTTTESGSVVTIVAKLIEGGQTILSNTVVLTVN